MHTQFDFVIIGGGIVGLTIAENLLKKNKNSSIAIFEKENTLSTT